MPVIALFIDDAATARTQLDAIRDSGLETTVVLVACAPRLTHRIGKWLTHSSREQWRAKWSQQLFAELQPAWGDGTRVHVQTLVAKGPLNSLLSRLRLRWGSELEVLDARRPRLAHVAEPLSAPAVPEPPRRWALPIAVTSGVSLVLTLAD